MKLRSLIAAKAQRSKWWAPLDWAAYWSQPGTWRRAPAHLRAWLRVRLWWAVVRIATRNKDYPFAARRA